MTISFDARDDVFVGRVAGMRDKISFDGTSVAELTQAFHDGVDSYLDSCGRKGKQPDRQYSGIVTLRASPEIHRQISIAAQREGISMNEWMAAAVSEAMHSTPGLWPSLLKPAVGVGPVDALTSLWPHMKDQNWSMNPTQPSACVGLPGGGMGPASQKKSLSLSAKPGHWVAQILIPGSPVGPMLTDRAVTASASTHAAGVANAPGPQAISKGF